MVIYGIKSCDTVRKARKWLDNSNQNYQFHDFRIDGLDQEKLDNWVDSLGWEKILNTRSTSWRMLNDQQKKNISAQSAVKLMLENPTLIKRPVLQTDKIILVGFKEVEYEQLL